MLRAFSLVLTMLMMATPALAHTGVGATIGLAQGLMHPLGGLDHVLAMVGVGLFAALLGGRAVWLVPISFVAMMALGGGLGMADVGLPLVETAIGLSVVALGAAVALRLDMRVMAAMAFVGFFAVFHGHAHGTEMSDTAPGLAYGAGFMLATSLLHAAGVALGLAIGKMDEVQGRRLSQLAGGGMALAGIAILVGLI